MIATKAIVRAAQLSAAICLLSAVRKASAESSPVALRYDAPPGCPSSEALMREINARLSPEALRDLGRFSFRIEIRSAPLGYAGRVAMLTPEDTGVIREVESADCAEVGRALAFIAAVIINPRSDGSPLPPSPNEQRAVPNDSDAAETPGERPPLPAQAPRAYIPEPRAAPPIRNASSRSHWSAQGSASLDAATARVPGVSLGPRFKLSSRYEPTPALGAEAGVSLSFGGSGTLRTQTGDADLTWLFLRTEGCALGHAAPSLLLAGCAFLEAGRLAGAGARAPILSNQRSPWLAPGALGRVVWQPLRAFELFSEAGLFAPLFRPTFYFTGDVAREPVHHVPGLGALVAFGASVRFP